MQKTFVGIFAIMAALLVGSGSAKARTAQWWFVADGPDRALFVDAGSIQREGHTVRYSSSLIIRDPQDEMGEQRAFMEVDCDKRSMQWPMVMRYGRDDRRLDESAVSYAGEDTVEAGSIAAAELDFVCAADRSAPGDTSVAFPLAVDALTLTEALIANEDTSVGPADIHKRLIADVATPRIRSTAPSPKTFGTQQRVAVGTPIVPPRDYARSAGIPPLADYDVDEVGRIYDVAYQGLDDGELAFEIRGYAADDLVHSGSGQTLRFPRDAKEAQVKDIAITIVEATPDHLLYRVERRVQAEPGLDAVAPGEEAQTCVVGGDCEEPGST